MQWQKIENGRYVSRPPRFEIVKTDDKSLPWQLVDRQMYRSVWKYCERTMRACKRLAERVERKEIW